MRSSVWTHQKSFMMNQYNSTKKVYSPHSDKLYDCRNTGLNKQWLLKYWGMYFSFDVSCHALPPLSYFPLHPLIFIISRENKCVILSSGETWPHCCPQAKLHYYQHQNSRTHMLANRILCLLHLKGISETRKNTNGCCFPIIPMAGSGTWLPCGMTPHLWHHPEVTPNLVLFWEANTKITISQLTSMCYPLRVPWFPKKYFSIISTSVVKIRLTTI